MIVEYLVLFQADFNLTELDSAFKSAFVLAILAVATIGIDGLLSSETKARVVLRKWKNPLPGSEAFSKYLLSDPRFDGKLIRERYAPLPSDPAEQNRLWYSIYRKHRQKQHILEALGRFMLMRDTAVMALLFVPVVTAIAIMNSTKVPVAIGAVVILLLEYIIAARAAKIFGVALVRDVLADEEMRRDVA